MAASLASTSSFVWRVGSPPGSTLMTSKSIAVDGVAVNVK
jgi:hypothetical protein